MAKIGLCEDDPAIRRIVLGALEHAGHTAVAAHDGREALSLFGTDDLIDVIVLDIGLPDADGRDVCQALRSTGQSAPVIFLTALGAVHDRLAGFSAGADDYLPKPFDVKELIARVEALARRGRIVVADAPGDLVLDPARHALVCDGREALLTPTEFRMLAAITSRRARSCVVGPSSRRPGQTGRSSVRTPSTPTYAGSAPSSRRCIRRCTCTPCAA